MIALVCCNEHITMIKPVIELTNKQLEIINKNKIKDISNIIIYNNFTDLIIDISTLDNKDYEIISELNKIKKSKKINIIVLAPGYEDISYINDLKDIGIKNIILDSHITAIKKELLDIFTSFEDEQQSSQEVIPPSKVDKRNIEVINTTKIIRKVNTIAICGVCPRIGVTTQAIQIIKYLKLIGKSACYLEANNRNQIKSMLDVYEASIKKHDKDIGMFECDNIHFYYKPENISKILENNYDFIIYDYANFNNLDLITYFEKDIKLIMVGTKPWEIQYLHLCLEKLENQNIEYLFSFSHENEHETVKEFMEDKASNTYFTNYTPDMFSIDTYTEDMYNQIFSKYISDKSSNTTNKNKKFLKFPTFIRR